MDLGLQHADGDQFANRLANRDRADLEFAGDLGFHDPVARLEFPASDLGQQGVSHLFSQ